jgi:hypothetical protein
LFGQLCSALEVIIIYNSALYLIMKLLGLKASLKFLPWQACIFSVFSAISNNSQLMPHQLRYYIIW